MPSCSSQGQRVRTAVLAWIMCSRTQVSTSRDLHCGHCVWRAVLTHSICMAVLRSTSLAKPKKNLELGPCME